MSHFNETERKVLAEMVGAGKGMQEISAVLHKHRTSVCRELKRNRLKAGIGPGGGECPLLQSPPHVCNGCRETGCGFQKWYYLPDRAHEMYRALLTSSRDGFNLTDEEIGRINEVMDKGCSLGQSPHHILQAHKEEIQVSEKTLYRLVDAGMLHVRRHNLRNAAGRKPRAQKLKPRKKSARKQAQGRTYEDFRKHLESGAGRGFVEMDSVVGRTGGKVLLTLNFNDCGLMLAFIRERNTAQSVVDIFNALQEKLGLPLFRSLFPAILTDNGAEFTLPERIETAPDGQKRTRVFFCHPYSASEKPHVENNHENLRKILGRQFSFDALTQEDIDLVNSHVNSMIRKAYGNRTAFDIFVEKHGREAADLLAIRKIPADDVCLAPSLLNGKLIKKQ